MRTNLHNYPFKINDVSYAISDDLLFRRGIVESITINEDSTLSYHVLMDDNQQIEIFDFDQLFALLSYAEIHKQQFLVTPTPTISNTPVVSLSRTPRATPTPTPTVSSSARIYPDLTDSISWTATNGTVVVNQDHSIQFKSKFNNNGSVSFSAPLNLVALTNYEFYVRFNEGTCQYILIELDLQDGTPTVVYKLKEQFSGQFRSSFKTTSSTSGGVIKVYMFDNTNYTLPAAYNTIYNFSVIDIKQLPPSVIAPTPTPSTDSLSPLITILSPSLSLINGHVYSLNGRLGINSNGIVKIDWGDSVIEQVTAPTNTVLFHTYESLTSPTIKIYGDLIALDISGNLTDTSDGEFGSSTKQNVALTDWGMYNVNNITSQYFIQVPTTLARSITNTTHMFQNAIHFNQDISGWNMSNVKDASLMFYGASIFNKNISQWNVGNIINMNSMFTGASAFNQDLSAWNTSNVTNMNFMFDSATLFNSNIVQWDVSNVASMQSMFNAASTFNQDLSTWCVTKIVSEPLNFDLSATSWVDSRPAWGTCPVRATRTPTPTPTLSPTPTHSSTPTPTPTISVTPSTGTATGALTFNVTNASGYNMYACDVTNSASIDWGDGTIDTIPDGADGDSCENGVSHTYDSVGNYIIKIYGNYSSFNMNLLDNDPGNSTSELTSWGGNIIQNLTFAPDIVGVPTNLPSTYTSLSALFAGTNLFNGDISSWDTSNVTDMDNMFANNTLFNGDISSWDTGNVTNMNNMFNQSIFNGDISSWDTSNVTDMSYMFSSSSFNGDISTWDTSNVTDMNNMFSGNASFNGDISGWNTISLTTTYQMFYNNSTFNQNISTWNTGNVTNMSYMFSGNTAFSKSLSGWNTGNVTDMSYMFGNTSGNAAIFNGDISTWNTSNVTNMDSMFSLNSSFNGDISGWNTGNVTDMNNMFNFAIAFNKNIGGWNVHNVSGMFLMFNHATAFNQNLSHWCVTNIPTVPGGFSQNTPAWTSAKPVWGTCPA